MTENLVARSGSDDKWSLITAYAVFSSIWVYEAYTINTLIIRSKPQTAQDPLSLVGIYIFLHWIFMFNPSELKKKRQPCSNPVSLWYLTFLGAGRVIEQKLHYQHLELVASGEDQVCDTDLAAAWDNSKQESSVCPETGAENTAWEALFSPSSAYSEVQLFSSYLITVITESLHSSLVQAEHEEMEWWNYLQDADYIRALSLPQAMQDLLLPAPARRNASSPVQIRVRWC